MYRRRISFFVTVSAAVLVLFAFALATTSNNKVNAQQPTNATSPSTTAGETTLPQTTSTSITEPATSSTSVPPSTASTTAPPPQQPVYSKYAVRLSSERSFLEAYPVNPATGAPVSGVEALPVCSSGFTTASAREICRMMGLVYSSAGFGTWSVPATSITGVTCPSGSANFTDQCQYAQTIQTTSTSTSSCASGRGVRLYCQGSPPATFEVKIDDHDKRLLYRPNSTAPFGSVCIKGMSIRYSPQTICRQLYPTKSYSNAGFGGLYRQPLSTSAGRPQYLTNVYCGSSSYTNFKYCRVQSSIEPCETDVAIYCDGTYPDFKLNSFGFLLSRAETTAQYAPSCARSFASDTGQLNAWCKLLTSVTPAYAEFFVGSTNTTATNYGNSGYFYLPSSATSFVSATEAKYPVCSTFGHLGLRCESSAPTFKLRFDPVKSTSSSELFLEIQYGPDSPFLPVCSDGLVNEQSRVRAMCGFLGRPTYTAYALKNVTNGKVNDGVTVTRCSSTYVPTFSPKKCQYQGPPPKDGVSNIGNCYQAQLRCEARPEFNFRVQNATGLVEVQRIVLPTPENPNPTASEQAAQPWGTVCRGSYFSEVTASAICKMVGKPYTGALTKDLGTYSVPNTSSMPILMRDLSCPGDATNSSTCTFYTGSSSSSGCSSNFYAVAVDCRPRGEYDIRLSPASSTIAGSTADGYSGTLQIRPKNAPSGTKWSQVCDDVGTSGGTISVATARQLCKLVGKPVGSASFSSTSYLGADAQSQMLISNLGCPSTAITLSNCSYSESVTGCSSYERLYLKCPPKATYDFMLGYKNILAARKSGSSGSWRSVCPRNTFGTREAQVACRSLGAPFSTATATTYRRTSTSYRYTGLTLVKCPPGAVSLSDDCEYTATSSLSECTYVVQLKCTAATTPPKTLSPAILDAVAGTSMRLFFSSSSTLPLLQFRYTNTSLWENACGWTIPSASFKATAVSLCLSFTNGSSRFHGANPLLVSPRVNATAKVFNDFSYGVSLSELSCKLPAATNPMQPGSCALTGGYSSSSTCSSYQSIICMPMFEFEVTNYRNSSSAASVTAGSGSNNPFFPDNMLLVRPEKNNKNIDAGPPLPWGTIASNLFTTTSARAICRSLGLPFSGAFGWVGDAVQSSYVPTYMQNFQCPSIFSDPSKDCSWQSMTSNYNSVISLACVDTAAKNIFEVGVQNISVSSNSYVENVLLVKSSARSQPMAVCDSNLGNGVTTKLKSTLRGFCNIMGLESSGMIYQTGVRLPRSLPLGIWNVNCPSDAKTTADCSFTNTSSSSSCYYYDGISLTCKAKTLYEFRLQPTHKILEVRPLLRRTNNINNNNATTYVPDTSAKWGTVCSTKFALPTATMICKTLGLPYTGASFTQRNALSPTPAYETGTPVSLTDFACPVDAANMTQCDYTERASCSHSYDVVVQCDERLPANYRLVVYSTSSSYYQPEMQEVTDGGSAGIWRRICYNNMDRTTTPQVLCRLGGRPWTGASYTSRYDSSNAKYFLNDVTCPLDAVSFNNCSFNVLGNCNSNYGALVICKDRPAYTLSYVASTGALLVKLSSSSSTSARTMCAGNNGLTPTTTRALCRILGMPSSAATYKSGSVSGTPLISNVVCPATARSLRDCSFDETSSCSYSNEVILSCRAAPAYQYRLLGRTNSSTSTFAQLQVRYDPLAQWGAVCSPPVDATVAAITAGKLCRFLGYKSENAAFSTTLNPAAANALGFKLSSVACPGPFEIRSTSQCVTNVAFAPCKNLGGVLGGASSNKVATLRCGALETTLAPSPPPTTTNNAPAVETTRPVPVNQPTTAAAASGINPNSLYEFSTTYNGAVLVRRRYERDQTWKYVCPQDFDDESAKNVCLLLGYSAEYLTAPKAGYVYAIGPKMLGGKIRCKNYDQHKAAGTRVRPDECSFESNEHVSPTSSYDDPSSSSSSSSAFKCSDADGRGTTRVAAVYCNSPEVYVTDRSDNAFFLRKSSSLVSGEVDPTTGTTTSSSQYYSDVVGVVWGRNAAQTREGLVSGSSRWNSYTRDILCAVFGTPTQSGTIETSRVYSAGGTIFSDIDCSSSHETFSECSTQGGSLQGGGGQYTAVTSKCTSFESARSAYRYKFRIGADHRVYVRDSRHVNTTKRGVWGTLCAPKGKMLSSTTATNLCRTIGYTRVSLPQAFAISGAPDGVPVIMSDMQCTSSSSYSDMRYCNFDTDSGDNTNSNSQRIDPSCYGGGDATSVALYCWTPSSSSSSSLQGGMFPKSLAAPNPYEAAAHAAAAAETKKIVTIVVPVVIVVVAAGMGFVFWLLRKAASTRNKPLSAAHLASGGGDPADLMAHNFTASALANNMEMQTIANDRQNNWAQQQDLMSPRSRRVDNEFL